jgi:hypothetical protein
MQPLGKDGRRVTKNSQLIGDLLVGILLLLGEPVYLLLLESGYFLDGIVMGLSLIYIGTIQVVRGRDSSSQQVS